MLRKIVFAGCLVGASMPALASNFSYTVFEVALGRASLDEKVILVDEVYEDFGVFSIGGGYQAADNFALSIAASGIANEGDNTEWTNTSISLSGAFPIPVGEQVDIVPQVGYVSVEAEMCAYGFCVKEDESGLLYGLGVRAWAIPGQFEVNASYSNSTIEDSERAIGIGAALWFQDHHSVRLNYADEGDISAFTIGYRYSW